MSAFFDTNILLYAQEEGAKGDRARYLLEAGGKVSTQVLNEFSAVSNRKFGRSWAEIDEAIADVLELVEPPSAITLDLHLSARALAAAHRLNFYDALIVAAAVDAQCDTLFSEDLQDGRKFGRLFVRNPFSETRPRRK